MVRGLRTRMKRREIEGGVRYLTFSCYHRLALLGTPLLRDVFVLALYEARAAFGFELFAWVVMPEHVHLVILPPPGVQMATILKAIKQSVAETVIARWKKLGARVLNTITTAEGVEFWQPGGGFDRNVRNDAELCREIRYIHRNPVERGLVENPEDWAWSSVRWWMGIGDPSRPCDLPPGDARAWRAWKGYV